MAEIIAVNPGLPSPSTLPASLNDDYLFVETRHPNTVLQGLNSLRLNNAFCDVTLCCGGQEFPCHRIVLASFSSYFQAMFSTDLIESKQERVAINGVEPQMIGMLVSYAYTSEVYISKANVQALLAAANLLDVMAVREACCRFMERQMDEMNCVGIHCFAEAHSCSRLESSSMDYILQHFSSVYQQVLEHIRLPLISPYYLHDVIESLDVVKENQGCQRLISEAKDYLLLKDRRGELYCPRARPRRSTGTAEVIVTVGGEDNTGLLRSVESFNPMTNQWKNLACLPFAVRKHGLVVSDSTLYLAGGELSDGSQSSEMWRYDSCCDSWIKMAPMNMARSSLGLAMLDGFVYAVGGWSQLLNTCVNFVERFDPQTNSWQVIESVKLAVASPAVVALDGLLYVTGGEVENGVGADLSQVYNPKSSAWTEIAPMQIIRHCSAACTLKGKLYVIGGWNFLTGNSDMESYNPKTDQWTMCTPMKKHYWFSAAVVDGKIYVRGGELRDEMARQDIIERYRDETDTWEIVGKMPTRRIWHSCVSLQLKERHPHWQLFLYDK
ncbi:kelch-like protein 20 isoform X2 [Micropterus salmoides]|uniref:kelch-like protein 20 isoform X2 n=1 Tax=Micropterus salmoides TaxID=27706 RepID=UPI0018EC8609|nr:kelch-like protein 20 isoform X2 [Micropterus salmoides]